VTTCVAFIRGINVGRAKRVAMADLRGLVERAGYADVRTVLTSGNVAFEAPRARSERIARDIEAAIERACGFAAAAIVLTAAELDDIVRANPHVARGWDAARVIVAFVRGPAELARARPLLDADWTPEAIALGARAAYFSCPNGVIASKVLPAFARQTAEAATTRTWATVLKVQAAAHAGKAARN
jgi:uncharacterized protein (DUF1697 family)